MRKYQEVDMKIMKEKKENDGGEGELSERKKK